MASGRRRSAGFTYLMALLLVAAVGFGFAGFAESWSHARQREKERELLWVGSQFRQAIGLYYERSPGGVRRYPEKLDDLLEDKRFATVQRYLRQIYADPVTGKADWIIVNATEGGIKGVRSASGELRILKAGGAAIGAEFVYEPLAPVVAARPGP